MGDASLGEWQEWSGYAYHVRRRMTSTEQLLVGEAVDLRGTAEAWGRLEACRDEIPAEMVRLALEEIAK